MNTNRPIVDTPETVESPVTTPKSKTITLTAPEEFCN